MRRATVFLLALAVIPSACATTGGSGRSAPRDVITAEQLADFTNSNRTVLDVVLRLQPRWLNARGSNAAGAFGTPTHTTPAVVQDGLRVANHTSYLSRIPVTHVEEIRFRNSREATMVWGTGFPNGAIELVMKH